MYQPNIKDKLIKFLNDLNVHGGCVVLTESFGDTMSEDLIWQEVY